MASDIPKYARHEFERRWLVDTLARPRLGDAHVTHISDRYIAGTRMRLRRMDRPDLNETKFKLTRKDEAHDASARPITSLYLTAQEYDALLACPAHELVKRRLHFRRGDLWWSLDLFEGPLAGLQIVECEADSAEALNLLEPPPWVLREVTHLAQWQCGALAQHGIPEDRWPSF
jgi:CYTH domain-containing protein